MQGIWANSTQWIGAGIALAVAAAVWVAWSGRADGGPERHDAGGWDWSLDRANPLYCMTHQSGEAYDVSLTRDVREPAVVTVRVSRQQKLAFQWAGHAYSVFQIVGDRLYFADYSPSSSGGVIVAVDLTAGRELWRSPLTGLGPIEHSKYSNRMNLAADAASVRVTGNESAGRYAEVKDAGTGRTTERRVFEGAGG